MMALRLGDHAQAQALADTALQWAQALGDRRARGAAHIALARVAYHTGDEHDALGALEAAWPELEAAGDPYHRIDCLTLLGAVLSDQDQPEQATAWHEQALAESQALRAQRPEDRIALRLLARAFNNVAARYVNQALVSPEPREARPLFERCVAAAEEGYRLNGELGLRPAMAVCCGNRALALGALGRFDEAHATFDEAEALRGPDRSNNDWLTGAVQRAQVLAMAGRHEDALARLDPALAEAEQRQALAVLSHGYYVAAEIAEQRGDAVIALRHFRRYHDVRLALAFRGAEARARALGMRMQVEQARAETERLRRVAEQDALTGLGNRRALDEALQRMHALARQQGRSLSAALIDLDHFKAVNDGHSHAVGDAVLRRVAALLQAACRERDLAARFGGEEFVVLLLDADLPHAHGVCERLRVALETTDWSDQAPGLRVTASFGVAELSTLPDAAEGLARADAALYEAKRQGRNRVVTAPAVDAAGAGQRGRELPPASAG